jgi:hypothetical protein
MRTTIVSLVAIGALALTGAAPGLQPGTSQIKITDRVVSETTSFSQRVIKTTLYNTGISPYPIGNSVFVCWNVGSRQGPVPSGSLECIGSYRFAHGNIQISGYIGKRGLYTLSVTGGTGIYSNTGAGQVAVVTIDLEPREQLLTFTLYST